MRPDTGLCAAGEWECMECGYIEEGVKSERPEMCPECSAPGVALEFFPQEDDDKEAPDVDSDLMEGLIDLDDEDLR